MSLQTILVLVIAAAAALYLARVAWRTFTSSGCAKGCGCGPKSEPAKTLIAPDELLVRVRSDRSGQRRQTGEETDRGNSGTFSA
jgi:hypothetical protein